MSISPNSIVNPQRRAAMRADRDVNWAMEDLRTHLLQIVSNWPDELASTEERAEMASLINSAQTYGALIDILYYDWAMWQDLFLLQHTIGEAAEH